MATLKELRQLAKDLGIRGYSTANKARLTSLIESHDHTQKLMANARASRTSAEPKESAAPEPESESTSGSFEAPKAEPAAPAPVPAAEKPKQKRKSSPNAWNSFLREYRAEHGVTLKEAMKQKDAYAKFKETWKRPEE